MTLDSIVDSIANRADELLSDVRGVADARSTIGEVLTAEFPKLAGVDRQKVTDAVIRILQSEGFFDSSKAGGNWSESEDASEEE